MPLINKLVLGTVQFGLPYGINNKTGQPSLTESLEILKEGKEKWNQMAGYCRSLFFCSKRHRSIS
jgi:hypothetical protein